MAETTRYRHYKGGLYELICEATARVRSDCHDDRLQGEQRHDLDTSGVGVFEQIEHEARDDAALRLRID